MSTRRVFWTLVHNDSRLGSTFRFDKARWNISERATQLLAFVLIFAFAGLLLGFSLHTSNLFAERFIVILNLIPTNEFTIFFLSYIPFTFTFEMISREWKNGTEGWWLSLPYSRKLLLAAKSLAGFFRFIKFLLIFVIATVFLTILTITLKPNIGNIVLLKDLPQRILYSSAISILISPFCLILGIPLAVFGKSQRKVSPIFTLPIIGSIILIYQLYTVLSLDFSRSPAWLSLLLILGILTGLSTLLFFFAAYVLENKVDL